ncbi:MAG: type II toxin-antitoxin system Y4mF family antitoxin [Gammaproteobacteria bacterium]
MTVSEIGRLVRSQRRINKLRQEELAAIAGVGTRFVSELENGKVSLEFGKVIQVLETAGLELSVVGRSTDWGAENGAE